MNFRCAVLLCLGFSAVAWAEGSPEINALAGRLVHAMKLGEIAVMGVRHSTEDLQRRGMTATQAACIGAVKPVEFEGTFRQVLAEVLTAAQLEEAVRFYESPSGQKYVAMTEVKSAEMIGARTNKTMPDFTAEDIEVTESFGKTVVFQILVNENAPTRSVVGRNLYQNQMIEIFRRCGVGR